VTTGWSTVVCFSIRVGLPRPDQLLPPSSLLSSLHRVCNDHSLTQSAYVSLVLMLRLCRTLPALHCMLSYDKGLYILPFYSVSYFVSCVCLCSQVDCTTGCCYSNCRFLILNSEGFPLEFFRAVIVLNGGIFCVFFVLFCLFLG
jgi:hypothetical protein